MPTYTEDKTVRSISFYARRLFGFRAIDNPVHSPAPFVSLDMGVTLSDLVIFVTQDVVEALGLTEQESATVFRVLSAAADRKANPADPMTTPLVERSDEPAEPAEEVLR